MKGMKHYDEVIRLKTEGVSNKNISNKLNISLSLVEKTLNLFKLMKNLKEILSKEQLKKAELLNYKALALNPLINNKEALKSLIDDIQINISLNKLKELVIMFMTKDEKVQELYTTLNNNQSKIIELENSIKDKEDQINQIKEGTKNIFQFLYDMPMEDKTRREILQAIGYDLEIENFVLIGFIDKNHYFKFRREGLIEERSCYLKVIPDIYKFVNKVIKTRTFKSQASEFQIYRRNPGMVITYINEIPNLAEIELNHYMTELEFLKKERVVKSKEYERICKTNPYDFYTVIEAKQKLDKKDLESHTTISYKGMEYLVKEGYISAMEYPENKMRFDVIGVNLLKRNIVILESKATLYDYMKDKKKDSYKNYCNEFYIITDKPEIKNQALLDNYSVIYINDSNITVYNYMRRNECILNCEEIVFKIYKKLYNNIYHI